MNASSVVTRFAPSPTGFLHLGNVRTALLNWLFARRHGGSFLLRFEDTDRSRSEDRYVEAIIEDLEWLGLRWDGEPRFQSARHSEHRQALETLASAGLAYRCFCSEQQLQLERKLSVSRGLPPRYAGRCRALSPTDAARRAAAGEPHVWRLAVRASEGEVVVPDLLRGDVRFDCQDLDDPVVVRSNGAFTFLLPNAVDDALDGITHVLRGDDHLTNSAYQVWLMHRLGYRIPVYLHHGLLLGPDGAKLSKRSGSQSVRQLRQAGLMPLALINAMARVGHPNIPDKPDLQELIAHFDASKLSTSAVRWDADAMWRWHARLLHEMEARELLPQIAARLPGADEGFVRLVQPNLSRIEDAVAFQRLLDASVPLTQEAMAVAKSAGADFYRRALEAWQEIEEPDWRAWIEKLKQITGLKGRALFLPLRVALSGTLAGPEMREIVAYLGRDGVQRRLLHTLEAICA